MAKKNKRKKTWKSWLFDVVIVLLVLVGLALIFNKPIRNMLIAGKTNSYQISKVTSKQIEKNKAKPGNFDFAAVKAVNFNDIFKNQFQNQPLPVIGAVAVPDVGINLPIFNGFGPDSIALAYGASTMKPNEVMGKGNYALASHNVTGYDSNLSLLFTPLTKAKAGMEIYITDKTNVYEYKITNVSVVKPDDTAVINDEPGKTEVTLVTCSDPEATARIIVRGAFEKKVAFEAAGKAVDDAFSTQYNQLNNW